jgi:hypothetical protein
MRVTRQSTAVLVLALEMLGERGEHWLKGDLEDGNGNYCMVGAMYAAMLKLKTIDHTCHIYLRSAVGRWAVITFNDRKCRKFADVQQVFHRAIGLSLTDPQLTLPFACEHSEPAVRENSPCLV